MELSVVIPVYNEADNIVSLVDEVMSALAGNVRFEIIYVDDASEDDTLVILKQQRQVHPEMRILQHAGRSGQSAALHTGIRAARGTWVATLDGDGQNDPADILPLYRAAMAQGFDECLWLVAGWRQQRRDSGLRRLSSRVANAVRRRILKDATPDTGCGLKLVYREAFLELPFFDHMHRFLPALILRAGGQVCSMPVNHRPRSGGESKYGVWNRLWVGIVDLLGVGWLQRRASNVHVIEIDER